MNAYNLKQTRNKNLREIPIPNMSTNKLQPEFETFGIILRNLREEHNLTQEDLAKAIGLTPGSIGNYEQGSRLPRNDTIKKNSKLFFSLIKID